jgi:dTDP-4-amino-4,6-dideoxygalactose transaminase
MSNISNYNEISKIIKTKFNYKTNNKLFKFLFKYSHTINYNILYDFIEIIYHSHNKNYNNAILKLESLHNKYYDFSSNDKAVMINLFNINYKSLNIFTAFFILNLTSCDKLLETNKELAKIYNIKLLNLQNNVHKSKQIPKIYIHKIINIIEKHKKKIKGSHICLHNKQWCNKSIICIHGYKNCKICILANTEKLKMLNIIRKLNNNSNDLNVSINIIKEKYNICNHNNIKTNCIQCQNNFIESILN